MAAMPGDGALPEAALMAAPVGAALFCYFARPRSFYDEQRAREDERGDGEAGSEGTLGATSAAITSALVVGGAYAFVTADTTRLDTPSNRALYGIGWTAVGLAPLAYSALRVLRRRAGSARREVQAGASDDGIEGEVAALRETAAATALVAPVTLALSLYAGPETAQVVPAVTALFLSGRIFHNHTLINGRKASSVSARYASSFGWGLSVLPAAAATLVIGTRAAQRAAEYVKQREPYRAFPVQASAASWVDSSAHPGLRLFAEETAKGGGARRFVATTVHGLWARYCLLRPEHRHYYELIREGAPCRLYFDIEFRRALNPGADGDALVERLLERVAGRLREAYGVDARREDVVDLDSSTPAKFSRHLVVHMRRGGAETACFRDNLHAGAFVRTLCRGLGPEFWVVADANGRTELLVDQGVYTRNRTFRLYLSSKRGKGAQLVRSASCVFRPPGAPPGARAAARGELTPYTLEAGRRAEFELFAQSLACAPDGLEPLECVDPEAPAPAPRASNPALAAVPATPPSSAGPSPFPGVDEHVARHALRPPGRIKSWRHLPAPGGAGTLLYQVAGSRYCGNVGREHRSNGVYVVADLDRAVAYQKCFDPACLGYRSEPLPLPAFALEPPPTAEEEAALLALDI